MGERTESDPWAGFDDDEAPDDDQLTEFAFGAPSSAGKRPGEPPKKQTPDEKPLELDPPRRAKRAPLSDPMVDRWDEQLDPDPSSDIDVSPSRVPSKARDPFVSIDAEIPGLPPPPPPISSPSQVRAAAPPPTAPPRPDDYVPDIGKLPSMPMPISDPKGEIGSPEPLDADSFVAPPAEPESAAHKPLTDDLELPAPGAAVPATRPQTTKTGGSLKVGAKLEGLSSTSLLSGESEAQAQAPKPKGPPTIVFDNEAAAVDYMVAKSMGSAVGPPEVGAVVVGQRDEGVRGADPPIAPLAPVPPPPRVGAPGVRTPLEEMEELELEEAADEETAPLYEKSLELAYNPHERKPAPSPYPVPSQKKSFPTMTVLFILIIVGLIVAGYLRQYG